MTERYGNVPISKVRAAFNAHREAIQAGDLERAWKTWGRCEEWLGWAEAEAVKVARASSSTDAEAHDPRPWAEVIASKGAD